MNLRVTTIGLAVVGAVIAIAVVAFFARQTPEPAAITGADRADQAREFIAEAREDADPKSYAEAYERAREFQRSGRLADAQLLYFYAARGGHAGAEFELAAMNDPNHHTRKTSLLAEPDAFQAYKWYSAAREHGSQQAQARLDALHEWAAQAAATGDSEAERVLLQWPQ
jgi:TPR repeat protein